MKIQFPYCPAALVLLAAALCAAPGFAQPPGFRGGDRGSGGERGSDRGSWGGRGDRGSSERGESSGRGSWGGRGGPPSGGGFSGGPPSGGPPSGRGSFDPSSFIERLDRNGNGMIDPDEMEGPAQFMIRRLQEQDPSIRTDRPIPISKFREAFDRMRGERESGDRSRDGSRDSSRESSRDNSRAALEEAMQAAPLVPGFGEPVLLEPVLGFGPSAELLSVTVTDADIKSAEESLQRYDRNKDGFLSADEISSRWTGNPMDFDRNGDGKLSLNELAVRAARMRVARETVGTSSNSDRRDDDRRGNRRERAAEPPDPYNGRRSFATTGRPLPEGLPGWFAEKDADGDHQVTMAEYATNWTPSLIAEFQSFDLNGDGIITADECLAAVRRGATASGGSGSSASRSSEGSGSTDRSSSGSSRGYGSRDRGSASSGGSSSGRSSGGSEAGSRSTDGELSERELEYARRIISRADTNNDGVLTPDEWKEMLVDPSAADADSDGRITVEEYARWLKTR